MDWFGLTIGEFDGGVNSGALTDLVGQFSPFTDLIRQQFSLSIDRKLMILYLMVTNKSAQ